MKFFKLITTLALAFVLLGLCACGPTVGTESTTGTVPQNTGSTEPGQSVEPDKTVGTVEPVGEFVQQPDIRDYTHLWWKDGWKATGGAQLQIQTGYYGLSIAPSRGQIANLGAIAEQIPWSEAAIADNELIASLPTIDKMSYYLTLDGKERKYSGVSALNDPSYGTQSKSRIIESGRYMQRVDVMNLCYMSESEVSGRLEVAAMPKYLSVEYSIWSKTGKSKKADLSFSFTLNKKYVSFKKSADGNIITASEENGNGLTFVMPNKDGDIALDEQTRKITVSLKDVRVKKNDFAGVNVIIIPSVNAKLEDAYEFYNNRSVDAEAVQVEPKEGKKQKADFDDKGYVTISLNNMTTTNTSQFEQPGRLDDLDRLKFTLTNDKDVAVKVPVQFTKTGSFAYIGCSPFLRDARTGEPIGVQVQLSKNWHTAVDFSSDDPATYLDGAWFNGYTYITVPAKSSVTYEFCMSYATWGGVFAASHSQLCLVGWGGGYQQWESSSIGAFGESFCYEAEMTHGRGFITDVRPLLIESIYGGKYNFTENIGGGNALVYVKASGAVGYKNVTTQFRKQGPNLTEVIYSGTSADGKIRYEFIANLPRTNDVSRVYHSFKYTFLEDVKFERLAFYQFGGDDYNDNHWDTMAVGNMDGPVSLTLDGKTYSGEFAVPELDGVGYFGGQMQRIDVEGEGLWMAFMGYKPVLWKKEPGANRMLNLMYYNASLNGKTYTKPSLSFYHTMNGGVPCVAVELSPAAECGNTIKKGSTVEGCVEWLNMPVAKSDYYGPSTVLKGMDAGDFNTYRLAYSYAKGGYYSASATVGKITKTAPIYVACQGGDVLAQITVKGGIGYVPMTFTGVPHYSGYRLQKKVGDAWETVDQSVKGNDYWQAWYDSGSGTYELTFNVEHSGDPNASYTYRLVKADK
ncbi:MAG: hypothetical protein IKK58_01130 [Clostridia bacterium]|nr:hypothetical protein [Clostridia bacterium]